MKRNSVLLLLFILLLLVAVACGCHIWRSLHAREKEQQVFENSTRKYSRDVIDAEYTEHEEGKEE